MSLLAPTRIDPAFTLFPANPYEGQTFVHVVANRAFKYQYNVGAADWKPVAALRDSTIYVDPVLGTDDLNHGIGPGADSMRTIQFAWDSIPSLLKPYYANILLQPGTYNESPVLVAKDGFTVMGGETPTIVTSLVATGGTQGVQNGAIATVTGAFVPGAHDELLIHFTSGANDGIWGLVGLTTAGTLYIPGTILNAAPINGDTYDICNWNTIINGGIGLYGRAAGYPAPAVPGMLIGYVRITGANTPNYGYASVYSLLAEAHLHYCSMQNNDGTVIALASADTGAYLAFTSSLLHPTNAAALAYNVVASQTGEVVLDGCRTAPFGVNQPFQLIDILYGGKCFIDGSEIDGNGQASLGVQAYADSYIGYNCVTAQSQSYIHGCTVAGNRTQRHSVISPNTNIVYGQNLDGTGDANGADESDDAATFSYIGA